MNDHQTNYFLGSSFHFLLLRYLRYYIFYMLAKGIQYRGALSVRNQISRMSCHVSQTKKSEVFSFLLLLFKHLPRFWRKIETAKEGGY